MLGHVFWSEEFSKRFLSILETEYEWPETADKLWEDIYIDHISELDMKIRKYPSNFIFEFDTLDELRKFDSSYIEDTRSPRTTLPHFEKERKIEIKSTPRPKQGKKCLRYLQRKTSLVQ